MARFRRLSDLNPPIIPTDTRWEYLLPAAPTGVTATAGNAQATVSWTAPTSAAPITDYYIQYSSNSGSTWSTFSDGTSTATSATVTGLTNGTTYFFRVAAVSGIGQGAWSTASSAVTPVGFAPIPVMTSATAPSGVVSDSGVLEATTQSWKAFDKASVSGDTTFYASPAPAPGNWIQYDYGYAVLAGGYQITSRQASPFGSTQAPDGWTLSGSANGTDFTTIDTRSVPQANWSESGEQKSFTLSSPQTYRFWRWTWTSGASTVVIPKIQLTAPA